MKLGIGSTWSGSPLTVGTARLTAGGALLGAGGALLLGLLLAPPSLLDAPVVDVVPPLAVEPLSRVRKRVVSPAATARSTSTQARASHRWRRRPAGAARPPPEGCGERYGGAAGGGDTGGGDTGGGVRGGGTEPCEPSAASNPAAGSGATSAAG